MRGWRYAWIVVLGCLLLAPGFATGRTLVVERDGSGEYTVIQDALDVAAPGDTVRIGPGRYDDFRVHTFDLGGTGAVIMIPTVSPLTILGVDRDSVIVGPAEVTKYFQGYLTAGFIPDKSSSNGLEILGITFERSYHLVDTPVSVNFRDCRFQDSEDNLYVAMISAPDVHFEGCEFVSTLDPNGFPNGIVGFVGGHNPNLLVEGCEFWHMGRGISITGATDCVIRDCDFHGSGLDLWYGSSGRMERCRMEPGAGSLRRLVVAEVSVVELDSVIVNGGEVSMEISEQSRVIARDCVFRNASYVTIDAFTGGTFFLDHCDIGSTGTLGAIRNHTIAPSDSSLVARNCFWGAVDSTAIADLIFDGNDDPQYEKVEFMPFLTHSVPAKQQSVGSFKALFGR